jgi:Ala-tRNA(Pro) deacylase
VPDIYAFLDSHGISYERHDHAPVFTVDDVQRLLRPLGGTQTKNLFLRDEKGRRHFLVVVGHDKQVDLRRLSATIGSTKLSFGSPDRLKKHLGIDPGSVSLLALINDPAHTVEVCLDREVWNTNSLCCHPLVNTATLVVPREGLERFLEATGHRYQVIEVPARIAETS